MSIISKSIILVLNDKFKVLKPINQSDTCTCEILKFNFIVNKVNRF